MALKIRIPFDKDFRNIGLNGAQPTAINTTIATTVGMDKCGSFNGSSSYLSLASGVDPTTSAFGFTTWVKVNSVSSNQCFFSQRNVVGQGYALFLLGTKMRFDTGANEWSMTTTFAAGVWYHIAVTYDAKKNVKNLYINGSLAETYAYNGAPISVGTNFTIGGSQSSDNGVASGNFLNGFLFDTRVYDNYLTAKDVSEIYACNLMDVCASSYYDGFIYDNSGFSPKHMEPSNIIFSGNSIYFNGTSSTIKYDGLNISGGTISIWFNTDKKTTNFMYADPVSHMGFAIYSASSANSLIIPWIGPSPGRKRFQSTLIQWGELNHVAVVFNVSGHPETCYINGASAAQYGNDYWSGSHTIASIGSRNNSGYFYKGYITRLTVYGK